MNRLLPWNQSGRAATILLALGVLALGLAAFAYRSEVIGSLCNDGWLSDSVGRGSCSNHDGVDTTREKGTLAGWAPVSWIEVTRWPVLLFGMAATTYGALVLAMSGEDSRTAHGGFVDLHVQVTGSGSRRQTTVTTLSGASASARFDFPGIPDRGAARLNELLGVRHKRRHGTNQSRAVEILGTDLFKALFPPSLEAMYRQAFDGARARDLGLRLVLELDDETTDLPWEYLHDEKRFLALSTEASVVRLLPVDDQTRPQQLVDTVRLLVMGSQPAGLAPIDIAGERARISQALERSIVNKQVEVDFVEGGTFDDLRGRLETFRPHVFHFAGHGTWDNDLDDGELIFESPGGGQHRVTGREIGVLLVRSGLRLVLLNSCNAARSSQNDRLAGIATSLVTQGVPAVLAMQFPIEDHAASTFGSTFLRHLVTSGSIDVSINEARLAVFTTQKRVEWGTPVLTTRVPIERVLPVSGDSHGRPPWANATSRRA